MAIWSAAWFPYVEAVVSRLVGDRLELAFLWGQERCTLRRDLERDRFYHAKNLKKVKRCGWDLSQVLIVDDDPVKVSQSYGNAVYVRAFYGDQSDNELERLLEYLLWIRDEPDYRRLEKRGWRGQLNRLRG